MKLRAVFYDGSDHVAAVQVQRLRKRIFVDDAGWALRVRDGCEIDQFDTDETIYLALFQDDELVGTFRACRSDHPYLADQVFPNLSMWMVFPHAANVWEISRFGLLASPECRKLGPVVYALMFRFAQGVGARSLVACTDLVHERFLQRSGIVTQRYGPPQIVGRNRDQRPIWAVAGDIPLARQEPGRLAAFSHLLAPVEIIDAAQIFGPARVSA